MTYMIVALYDARCLDDLMLALTAQDVRDAVVLDGRAVGSSLIQQMPIFAGFDANLREPQGAMKLVLAVVQDDGVARAIREDLRDIGVDLGDPATANVLLLPVEQLT
jgi:hypothetical protein